MYSSVSTLPSGRSQYTLNVLPSSPCLSVVVCSNFYRIHANCFNRCRILYSKVESLEIAINPIAPCNKDIDLTDSQLLLTTEAD